MQIAKIILTKCKISDINILSKSQLNVKLIFYKCTKVRRKEIKMKWEWTCAEDGGIWKKGGSYEYNFKSCCKCKTGKQRYGISQYTGICQAALAALSDLPDAGVAADIDF